MPGSLRRLYGVLGHARSFVRLQDSRTSSFNMSEYRNSFHGFGNWQYGIDHCDCVRRRRSESTRKKATDVPFAAYSTVDNERQKLLSIFPDIVKDLTNAGLDLEMPEANKRFAKVLQYNVPGGKMTRGLAVVHSYHMLTQDSLHTAENMHLAQIMGWCVEMLQAFFIVLDDIMDKSVTRRGRTCWYLCDDIGLTAVNDGLLLESGVYHVLRRYFQDKPYYIQVLNLFHDVTFRTTMGQSLDLLPSQMGKKPDYTKFTMVRYNAIVKYKTAYYSFHLPVALAMHMAGFENPEAHHQAKAILLEMGHFFQVQDDYLDCFGDYEVTGKVGSDIATGKCSWLAVTALQRVNHQQRIVFEECYASPDAEKVATIRELYEQLGLKSVYADYEEQMYNLICRNIQHLSHELPHQLFLNFLEKIYRRGS